jgi:hypothetical protein
LWRSIGGAIIFSALCGTAAHVAGESSAAAEWALAAVGYVVPSGCLYLWYGRRLQGGLRDLEAWRDAALDRQSALPIPLHQWEWLLGNMVLPPEQRAYTDVVTVLWQAAESGALPEEEARAILGDLNALAAAGRSLEARGRKLAEEQRAHDAGALTAERERLVARRDATADEHAGEAFAQGVGLLDGRLARVEELARLRERVEAERTVCAQAFASLHASLLSLGAAGSAHGVSALRAAEEARTAAARLAGRVRAAEEVAALRAGVGAG